MVSSGAVAGIAVGSFLAGTSLVGAVWALQRRRQDALSQHEKYDPDQSVSSQKHSRSEKSAIVPETQPRPDGSIPCPLEEYKIIRYFTRFRERIKEHVLETYHLERLSTKSAQDVASNIRNLPTGFDFPEFETLLIDPAT